MSALNDVIASLLAERYAGEWWPTEKQAEAPDELAGVRRRRELVEEVEIAEWQMERRRKAILRERETG